MDIKCMDHTNEEEKTLSVKNYLTQALSETINYSQEPQSTFISSIWPDLPDFRD